MNKTPITQLTANGIHGHLQSAASCLNSRHSNRNTAAAEIYFKLKEHGAQDGGRYDYLYDISRIEKVCQLDSQFQAGYAIMLSNDSAYWKSPSSKKTVDADFRIHEGRSIGGICAWDENASAGTIRSREMPIVLDGTYSIHWDFYSEIENANNGQFKLCLIEIKKCF